MGFELLELSKVLRTHPEFHYNIIYMDTESEADDTVQAGVDAGGLTVYAWNQVFKQMEAYPLFEKEAVGGVLCFRPDISLSEKRVEQFQDVARLLAKAVRLHEGSAAVDGESEGNGQQYLQRFSDAIYRSISEFNFESSIDGSWCSDRSSPDVENNAVNNALNSGGASESVFARNGLVVALYKMYVDDPLRLGKSIDLGHFDLVGLSESDRSELTLLARIVKPELLKGKPDTVSLLDWLVELNVADGRREALALMMDYAVPYFLLAETFHTTFSKLGGRPFTDSQIDIKRIQRLFQGVTLQHQYRQFKTGSEPNCVVVEQSANLGQQQWVGVAKGFFDSYFGGLYR